MSNEVIGQCELCKEVVTEDMWHVKTSVMLIHGECVLDFKAGKWVRTAKGWERRYEGKLV